ncbi:MAG: peptidylprolyl isomerase [Elusimicrobia bacterium]|nr:peptidylprolyl isomerase [Elusimicrobiota bacterium]
MKIINSLLALALLSAAVAAAPAGAAVMDEVAVKVNNEAIMRSEYNKAKDLLIEQYRAAMPDFFKAKDAKEQIEKAALDKLVDEALLKQTAETLKIKISNRELDNGMAEIKKRFSRNETGAALSGPAADNAFRDELKKEGLTLEQFRSKIRNQLMVRKLIEDTVRTRTALPKEAELKGYFEKITLAVKGDTAAFTGMDEESTQDLTAVAQRFKEFTAERIRVRHILFKFEETAPLMEKNKALKKAEDAKKELDGGADFEDLAAKYSDDKESAPKGGDLGYVVKGMLPKEIEEKAFALPLGEASNPVLTRFGYHLLRVDEKRIAQKLEFDQVKDDLEQLLAQANFAKELANYLKDLRKDAKIQVFK